MKTILEIVRFKNVMTVEFEMITQKTKLEHFDGMAHLYLKNK